LSHHGGKVFGGDADGFGDGGDGCGIDGHDGRLLFWKE
jgi:hypothetical protein